MRYSTQHSHVLTVISFVYNVYKSRYPGGGVSILVFGLLYNCRYPLATILFRCFALLSLFYTDGGPWTKLFESCHMWIMTWRECDPPSFSGSWGDVTVTNSLE